MDLSNHTFTMLERNYLCNFSAFFQISVKELCRIFNIKIGTFNKWKEQSTSRMNPLDILLNNDCAHRQPTTVNKTPVDAETQTSPISSNYLSQPSAFTNRKKHFSDYDRKYQSVIIQDLFQYLVHSPTLGGFERADKEEAILSFAHKYTNRNIDSTSNKLLRSLLATFKSAIISAIKKKDPDLLSQLLSLLFPSFTLKQIQQEVYPISPYNWNKAHRHLLAK